MKRVVRQPEPEPSEPPPGPLTLVHLTEAYNRGEISFEQWLEQTRAWAEAVVRYHKGEPYTEGMSESSYRLDSKKAS